MSNMHPLNINLQDFKLRSTLKTMPIVGSTANKGQGFLGTFCQYDISIRALSTVMPLPTVYKRQLGIEMRD
jgi:hypothetical protein